MTFTVRDLEVGDRPRWDELWALYLDFYGVELDPEVSDATFARVTGSDARMGGLAAVDGDGLVVGLAHYVVQPTTWSVRDDVYLEDLVVDPRHRGGGAGRALIEALADLGRARGWRDLHWLTAADNHTARRLYDRVGTLSEFVRYEISLHA